MKTLSDKSLLAVSGGANPSFSRGSLALINFLKHRADMLEALMANDADKQSAARQIMLENQKIVLEEYTFDELRDSGCVGPEVFLY